MSSSSKERAALAAQPSAANIKEQEQEPMSSFRAALQTVIYTLRRCVSCLTRASPPEPCAEVQELLRSLRIMPEQMLQVYQIFHHMNQEELGKVVIRSTELSTKCLHKLITERQRWVTFLLTRLLKLGNCEDKITWDQFLWIFLRFCSLNRVELGQVMFLMIAKEVGSPTLHYLTVQELQAFYMHYKNCPVRSFNTEHMDFSKLPLTRLYPSDFCEVAVRFPRLLNPLVHLQQSLQVHTPNAAFWDNFDQTSFCRKVTFEFFIINPHRVFLRGEPPFRETCDMLAPDALGPVPVNPDQWILRTSSKLNGKGLHQRSVWGEQLPPEVVEMLPHSSKGPEVMAKALEKLRAQFAPVQNLPEPVAAWSAAPDKPPPPADWSRVRAAATEAEQLSPGRLALEAAVLNEEDAWPIDVLPPAWMKHCTVAPAPVVRGPDPPLARGGERRREVEEEPLEVTLERMRRSVVASQ